MPAPEAARRHYLAQKAIADNISNRARLLWAGIDQRNLDASWKALSGRMFAQVSAGQLTAATQADLYLDAVLAEQGIDPARTASVNPRAFAGVTSDGRSLDVLLVEPVIATKIAIGGGAAIDSALSTGLGSLMRIVTTQVQDAGRTAVGSGMIARPAVTSYTRMLNPPSCSRCVVLAGKVYRFNEGFKRHPRCNCTHISSNEDVAGDLTTDPAVYFKSLSAADQDKYFTKAGAEVIRGGGDMGQVVNARLGMYEANDRTYTTVGTTKRGFAGKRLKGERRLMPEGIFAEAGDDRELAVALLRKHGYLI